MFTFSVWNLLVLIISIWTPSDFYLNHFLLHHLLLQLEFLSIFVQDNIQLYEFYLDLVVVHEALLDHA